MGYLKKLIVDASKKARQEVADKTQSRPSIGPGWPITCNIGPGLEGAVACDSKVGFVNGERGELIYGGYNIFDLCAHSTFEEVCYLLLHGELPDKEQFAEFNAKLIEFRDVTPTLRLIMGFPLEEMGPMAALRMGTNMLRQELTRMDERGFKPRDMNVVGTDEDSIAMETKPTGETKAIYEFKKPKRRKFNDAEASGIGACYHLISATATIAAAICRIQRGKLPIDPDPELSHAANLLYMMSGKRPTADETRIMDIALILHADHGMNASTFAAMVVASTLSDFYLAVGSGIAALNGPLHGGANEQVIHTLEEVAEFGSVKKWFADRLEKKGKVPGFGHRVYKTYDPRARVLGPLAEHLVATNPEAKKLYNVALALEKEVVDKLGKEKNIFPNVDFWSGIVYSCLGIPTDMFTPIFAVSRVAGWTARVLEYSMNNRIFRPRARYTGEFDKKYVSFAKRGK